MELAGFQSGAFEDDAFQVELVFVTAFQPDAFQVNAFQIVPVLTPTLAKEVNVDGGWSNQGLDRVEIVDDVTPVQLREHLDRLWDDNEEEYQRVEPDFVFGKGEYERERASRRESGPELHRPTSFSFDPALDEQSHRRAVMLAADARLRGMPLLSADVFPLRYKLGVFDESYERLMRGGAMIRLEPRDPAAIPHVARLARLHYYRLVIWTPVALYVFDKTTLKAKVPGAVWMAIGASMALWVGSEVSSHNELLAEPARPVQKEKKSRKR
jgi:hypothetical protein